MPPKTGKESDIAAEEQSLAAPLIPKELPRPAPTSNPSLEAAKMEATALLTSKIDVVCDPPRHDWRDMDFSGKDLTDESRYNFKRADFSGAKLVGANFSGKDLQGSFFRKADVAGANFSGADLRWCDFEGAIGLMSADFSKAKVWETAGL